MESFRWKPSWYQNETATINEMKTGSAKPVRDKTLMKKRGVGGREVAIGVRRKIIKMASQQKNERDLRIYTQQMLYLII